MLYCADNDDASLKESSSLHTDSSQINEYSQSISFSVTGFCMFSTKESEDEDWVVVSYMENGIEAGPPLSPLDWIL